MAAKTEKGDFTEEKMKEFDRIVQKTGRFPADTVFDPRAGARGEPRYRKLQKEDMNPPIEQPAEQ